MKTSLVLLATLGSVLAQQLPNNVDPCVTYCVAEAAREVHCGDQDLACLCRAAQDPRDDDAIDEFHDCVEDHCPNGRTDLNLLNALTQVCQGVAATGAVAGQSATPSSSGAGVASGSPTPASSAAGQASSGVAAAGTNANSGANAIAASTALIVGAISLSALV